MNRDSKVKVIFPQPPVGMPNVPAPLPPTTPPTFTAVKKTASAPRVRGPFSEAEVTFLVAHLDPVIRRAQATVAPNVTVNSILLRDVYDCLLDYAALLRKANEMAEEVR